MSEIRKGRFMHTRKVNSIGDEETWIFPKDFEGINDDTYYEIEYNYRSASDPCDFSCIYIVKSIKPLSKLMTDIYEIIEKYKEMDIDKFEEFIKNNYEIRRL